MDDNVVRWPRKNFSRRSLVVGGALGVTAAAGAAAGLRGEPADAAAARQADAARAAASQAGDAASQAGGAAGQAGGAGGGPVAAGHAGVEPARVAVGSATAEPARVAVGPVTAAAGATRKVTIYAEALPGGLFGYGLAPGKATVPGPVLEMWEGDTLEITLVNTTTQRLSIHPHGVDYSTDSDGSPFNASFNNPGETRTYVWRSREMFAAEGRRFMPGSAGYWHYHDHAMGTDHGTGGLARGLYGALIVRRRGDILPEKQFTVVFNDMMINNRVAPATPMFEANLGQRVEWLAIGHGGTFHTFHLHAHRWADNRTGMLEGPTDSSQVIDNKDLNPGSSFGFQVLAGEGVGPGAWMYHCHVQFHSDGGMAGIFLVRNADGSMPPGAEEAIQRFQGHVHSAQHG